MQWPNCCGPVICILLLCFGLRVGYVGSLGRYCVGLDIVDTPGNICVRGAERSLWALGLVL